MKYTKKQVQQRISTLKYQLHEVETRQRELKTDAKNIKKQIERWELYDETQLSLL